MRRVVLVLGVIALLLASAGGGWWGWSLWTLQRQTAQQLGHTEAALTERQRLLALAEEEHRNLSRAYEELKDRWMTTDREREALSQSSAQLTKDLSALTSERSDLQQQLEETRRQRSRLEEQVQIVQRDLAEASSEKATLERHVQDAASRPTLTMAEFEQLSLALAQRAEREQQLRERLLKLSRAYEQLAQASPSPQRQSAKGSSPASPSANDALHRLQQAEARRNAAVQRKLGEAYFAIRQYDKASAALEESLRWRDDPAVHAKLAFLYTRMLSDRERAARHAAAAKSRSGGLTSFGSSYADAQGLPRSSRRLTWRWLTQ